MRIDNYVDRKIGSALLAENEKERQDHKKSGKLSASQLGDPLQWQILKALGYETEAFDEYTLRKFKRGKDIEEWVMKYLEPIETQKFVEYRNTVGYIDAVCDTENWDFKLGVIPVEVKSVANAKFKRIVKQGPDRGHCLQASFYALATGKENAIVCYVASDDLRVHCYVIKTADFTDEIEKIITRFQEQLKSGEIPVFEAIEKWQADNKYCRYLEFRDKTKEQLAQLKTNANIA